jgi:hypothetical protein
MKAVFYYNGKRDGSEHVKSLAELKARFPDHKVTETPEKTQSRGLVAILRYIGSADYVIRLYK